MGAALRGAGHLQQVRARQQPGGCATTGGGGGGGTYLAAAGRHARCKQQHNHPETCPLPYLACGLFSTQRIADHARYSGITRGHTNAHTTSHLSPLRPCRTALIEMVPNTLSLHTIKSRSPPSTSLSDHFFAKFGRAGSPGCTAAQRRFTESLAAYSLICYLLQIKDRHNGESAARLLGA